MKRCISFISAMILLLTAMSMLTVSAAAPKLSVSSASDYANDNVTVTLTAENFSGVEAGIVALDFGSLEFVSVKSNIVTLSKGNNYSYSNGIFRYVTPLEDGFAPIFGDTDSAVTVFTFNLKIPYTSKKGSVHNITFHKDTEFSNSDVATITPTLTAGAVIVSGDATIQGKAAAPTLKSKTNTTVTLNPVSGCEYSKNGTAWQTSNIFKGLSANTSYTFYQRYAEKDGGYVAGAKSNGLAVKTYPSGSLLVKEGSKWYYFTNGVKQTTTGLVKHTNGKYYYVKKGIWQSGYKGLAKHTNGKWYYTVNGIWQSSYQGLAKHTNGKYYYVKKGIWQSSYNGLVKYNNKWYYASRGIHQTTTGFVKHTNGKYYYVKKGIWQSNYKGLVKYSGKWYYTVKGIRQYSTQFAKHTDGKQYYVSNGIFRNVTGFVKISGKWYYVKKGIRQYTTGRVLVSGKYYTVKNGIRQ